MTVEPVVWISLLVFGPLVAALLALEGRPRFIRFGLALGSGASLVGSAGLWWTVAGSGPVRHALGGWSAPLGIELRADGLSVGMLALTAVVGSAVSLYSTAYFGSLSEVRASPPAKHRATRFFAPLWLLLWPSLNGIYLSGDLFNLYVTLEILGLTAAAMVTLAATSRASTAAMRYLVLSLMGSLLFLSGVALLYVTYGALSLEALAAASSTELLPAVALAVMTVGLAVKTALFPFHGWLPPAHASAPAPGSALLSALVVKASFYILLRLWVDVYGDPTAAGLLVLGLLGAAAILWGSILALRQVSLKQLVAYSTVAQLGYLFVMFPLLWPQTGGWGAEAWAGGLLHGLSHGVAKAAMFLAAGCITYAVARDDLPSLSGLAHRLPVSFFAFGVAGMGLAGIPPSGGFVAKWLMLRSAAGTGQWGWVLVIGVGGVLTAAYVLLVIRSGLGRSEADEPVRPVPRRMEWTALGLALLGVVMGLWPNEILALLEVGFAGAGEAVPP